MAKRYDVTIYCSKCGPLALVNVTKAEAIKFGNNHIKDEHDGVGRIDSIDELDR